MADRIPQYPMLPNFNTSMHQQQLSQAQQQQQQQPQQPQQQPQHDSQQAPVPGFANPEPGRMWQQMQHMQNQFRPHSGADINGSQANQQVADLIRSQNLARVQGQQQMGQQQQFALGVPQMSVGGSGQTSFHDQANQQPQSHMPPNFANMGIPTQSLQQSLNSRNAMLQAFQPNQGHNNNISRQLELMGLAQSQQAQNGSMNFATRMAPQQQHQAGLSAQSGKNQPSQVDIFSPQALGPNEGMRRPSPSHPTPLPSGHIGNQQSMQPNNQGMPAGRRHMTFGELKERATALRAMINNQENAILQFTSQRAGLPDAEFMTKMQSLKADLKNKRDYLNKVVHAITQMAPNGMPPTVGNLGTLNAMGTPSAQQQGGPMQGSQSQPQWGSQPGPSQQHPFRNPQMGGAPHSQSQPQNIRSSPSHLHAQANNLMSQNAVPPRSGPTPHQQHPNGPFPTQMSPNMGPQFPFQMNGPQSGSAPGGAGGPQTQQAPQNMQNPFLQMPPPLEKGRFEGAYKSYCATKNIVHDARLMSVESRPIDLHALHTQVMNEGGGKKVNQKELWAVIGGRMGFVQFPGTETDPAKSGPGVAQHLAHVYKEYLAAFDGVYITSVLDSRRKMQAANAVHQAQSQLNLAGNGGQQQQQNARINAQQMQRVIAYANQPASELRAQGVQENIIQFVETNRAHLQRTVMEQGLFRGHIRPNQPSGQQPSEQAGMSASNQEPFAGSPLQPNSAIPNHLSHSGARPPQFMQQQHSMQGGNFMDNRQPQGTPQNGSGPMGRPTHEQTQAAMNFIMKVKQDFVTHQIPHMRVVDIPLDQRIDYNNMVEQLHRFAQELDHKLPMYFIVLKNEDVIKKLIAIILTIQQQKTLSSSQPRFVVSLEMLHHMVHEIRQANEMFTSTFQTMMNKQQHHQPPNNIPLGHNKPTMPPQVRPQIPQSLPQQPPPQSIPPPPANRPPVSLQPPPAKKRAPLPPGPSSAAISTPTPPPAPSASTPIANASTPTHAPSSPQAPKSPKGKVPAKPKAPASKGRRMSKIVQPPAPEPVQPLANTGSTKRHREEDTSVINDSVSGSGSSVANEPSPPKRIKTEWEGPPNDDLKLKQEAVENIKTEEDASAFLEQMTELIKMAAGGEGQESLTSDISETLGMILKGYGTVPDAPDGISMPPRGLRDTNGPPISSSPSQPPVDEFVEFFDFSSFGTLDDDDGGSKAPTPDLVSSSSTNPSPESGSESDAAHHLLTSDIKTEEFTDPLRLGTLKEVDGGESAYYHPSEWKWDSPMPMLEQPWAIFTS